MVSPVASMSLLIGSDVHHFVFTVFHCITLLEHSNQWRGTKLSRGVLSDLVPSITILKSTQLCSNFCGGGGGWGHVGSLNPQ